ncbi:MAG: peptidase M17 [Bacteroidales bacterium]|nr:peptidase M17 [Bacteroidales bacterium]
MHTIIDIVDEMPDGASFVCLAHGPALLPAMLFSREEKDHINLHYKEYKTKRFVFSRPGQLKLIFITGKEKPGHQRLENCRKAGFELLGHINNCRLNEIFLPDSGNSSEELLALAEGMALSNYQFVKYKTSAKDKTNSLASINIVSGEVTPEQVDRLNIIVDATCKCRDMVNEPVAWMNAVKLSDEIRRLGREASVKVEVLNKKKIETLKMGGLLAVNKGSVDPPTFTIMEWKPDAPVNKKPVIFTGKGVVFDTGGMNIKTGDHMNNMKCDMAGGASVAAAIYAIARAKLNVHVIGLIPATDNRTNGNAYVNGDIIRMHDGTTVEIINTDAEGRMILADALSYAKKYKPMLVINLATLTGSASRTIGKYGIVGMHSGASGFFSKLKKSGEQVYERVVEFPFWDEYKELIKSDVADIKNLGGTDAGAITAGKFLEHFTGYPFIHLDIAGPAFNDRQDSYRNTGGTGTGVRLLFDFIRNL